MVAGETSGDTLGADLILALKARFPQAEFIGIGGPKMLAAGLQSWYPMETLSVMGFFEVIKRLPTLLRLRKRLIRRLKKAQPDLFIGIDAPDFNFTVERQLKASGIATLHYVGPSIWAWREKRLEKMKQTVDGVLVLFPFEPPYYQRYQIPVAYVGHPLAQQVPEQPNKATACTRLGLAEHLPITAILPGSRLGEIEQMIDLYLHAAAQLLNDYPQMHFVIPAANPKIRHRIEQALQGRGLSDSITLLDGQAQLALEACDQALVTSGTATLETALMRRPLVLAIKVHPISYWIMKRLATTKWIGLPNVLAQQSLVSELIQDEATAPKIAAELRKLIEDSALRQNQLTAFAEQYDALKQPSGKLALKAIQTWFPALESEAIIG
ncbi:MAG: lipid-A-disaccharide synthase [Thiotrichales bacterium]|nr:lipid-A-disaccharide synthase [Thiotrichales bacterium]